MSARVYHKSFPSWWLCVSAEEGRVVYLRNLKFVFTRGPGQTGGYSR